MKFRIRADWMQACGRGNEAVTVDVVKFLGYMPNGKDAMYEVRMPDGRLWTVSDWRGEVIDGELTYRPGSMHAEVCQCRECREADKHEAIRNHARPVDPITGIAHVYNGARKAVQS